VSSRVPWEPITRAELDELLATAVAELAPDARSRYERLRVEPVVVQRIFERDPSAPVPTYVIARSGSHVLFYDDIEEEWGTTVVSPDGRIHDWGTWGEGLHRALRSFPEPAALRPTE
jgi:hypothetical protein